MMERPPAGAAGVYPAALAYTELVLTLEEDARKKILEKTRQLRKRLAHELEPARPP
jgi:hypothetical protein